MAEQETVTDAGYYFTVTSQRHPDISLRIDYIASHINCRAMGSNALNFVAVAICLCGSCVLHFSVATSTNLDLKNVLITKCEEYKNKHSEV